MRGSLPVLAVVAAALTAAERSPKLQNMAYLDWEDPRAITARVGNVQTAPKCLMLGLIVNSTDCEPGSPCEKHLEAFDEAASVYTMSDRQWVDFGLFDVGRPDTAAYLEDLDHMGMTVGIGGVYQHAGGWPDVLAIRYAPYRADHPRRGDDLDAVRAMEIHALPYDHITSARDVSLMAYESCPQKHNLVMHPDAHIHRDTSKEVFRRAWNYMRAAAKAGADPESHPDLDPLTPSQVEVTSQPSGNGGITLVEQYAAQETGPDGPRLMDAALSMGMDVEARSHRNETSIHSIASTVKTDPVRAMQLLKVLLKHGADPNAATALGDRPLIQMFRDFDASAYDRQRYPNGLTEFDFNDNFRDGPSSPDPQGRGTASLPHVLSEAQRSRLQRMNVKTAHNALSRELLLHGADPNAVDIMGQSPLRWCAMNSNIEGAHLLLAAGADPLQRDMDGMLAVHYAFEGLRYLITEVRGPIGGSRRDGQPANQVGREPPKAIREHYVNPLRNIGEKLTEHGVGVATARLLLRSCRRPLREGEEPSPYVMKRPLFPHFTLRRFLPEGQAVGQGAQRHQVTYRDCDLDSHGGTRHSTLLPAVDSMNVHLLQILLMAGANPNAQSEGSGMTALHFAAARGHPRALQVLLKQKQVDPCLRDGLNLTMAGHYYNAGGDAVVPQLVPVIREYLPGGSKVCPGDENSESILERSGIRTPPGHMDLSKSVGWAERLLDDATVDGHSPPAKVIKVATALLDAREGVDAAGKITWEAAKERSFEDRFPWANHTWEVPYGQGTLAAGLRGEDEATLDRLASGERGLGYVPAAGTEEWQRQSSPRMLAAAQRILREAEALGNGCDVAVRHASNFTHEEFMREFFYPQKPVLVKGGVPMHPVGFQRLRYPNMNRTVAMRAVTVGGVPYAMEFGQSQQLWTFGEFMEYMKDPAAGHVVPIIARRAQNRERRRRARAKAGGANARVRNEDFDIDPNMGKRMHKVTLEAASKLLREYNHRKEPLYISQANALRPWFAREVPLPDFVDDASSKPQAHQLFFGTALAGAPIHHHMDAVNMTPFGQRRWFVLPPHDAVYSATQVFRWLREERPRLGKAPLQCTQEAGDAFFVPHSWAHAVFNTKATTSVAIEFHKNLGIGQMLRANFSDGLKGPRPSVLEQVTAMRIQQVQV